jgi:hypothetical protein
MTDIPLESIVTYLIIEKVQILIFSPIFLICRNWKYTKGHHIVFIQSFFITKFTKIQFHDYKEQSS